MYFNRGLGEKCYTDNLIQLVIYEFYSAVKLTFLNSKRFERFSCKLRYDF